MSTGMPADPRTMGLKGRMIPSIAVIGGILANCYIIWFLLIDYPTQCARFAIETAGRQTCGIEAGAYVIATLSAILILAGVFYLVKWSFPQEE
jgi:Na+/H+ antiporter NhaA